MWQKIFVTFIVKTDVDNFCPKTAWISKAKELKGGEGVVGEDGGPAEEEDRHDQDQHVDHLWKVGKHVDHLWKTGLWRKSPLESWKKRKKMKKSGNHTFLVSASLLKVRGAAIIWKKRKL